ncbi:MAG: type II secretion system minor pseudopilin GspK [Deferrisomatales bacterium]
MKGDRGAALLLVVLLVSLLAILVVEFQREARLELRTAGNLRDAVQAAAYLRSGVTIASAVLLEEAELDQGVDDRGEEWYQPDPMPLPLGNVEVAGRLVDLDGRFPLGALVDPQGKAVPNLVGAYRQLLEGLELEEVDLDQLVEALVDWIDAGEDGLYEDQEHPVPNRPLENLEDLGRVEGYTAAVLAKVLPVVDTRSEKTVNVNTAPVAVLGAMHAQMTRDRAEELYADLGETPLTQPGDFKSRGALAGLPAVPYALDAAVQSRRFQLQLATSVNGVVRRAEALLERKRQEKVVRLIHWREE